MTRLAGACILLDGAILATVMVKREALTDMGLWDREDWPVQVVEAVSCIPRKLQMLPLILANGDMCCPVIKF
jgi:hypothetical protein